MGGEKLWASEDERDVYYNLKWAQVGNCPVKTLIIKWLKAKNKHLKHKNSESRTTEIQIWYKAAGSMRRR